MLLEDVDTAATAPTFTVPSGPAKKIPVPADDAVVVKRTPEQLFDWVESTGAPAPQKPNAPDTPGYFDGILRGTRFVPVFSDGKNWFTKGLSDGGNWIAQEIAKALKDVAHKPLIGGTTIPLGSSGAAVRLDAGALILREEQIAENDPKRLAIVELRSAHPGAVPLWVQFDGGAGISFSPSHTIPLGTSGAFLRFGFATGAGVKLNLQRLLYVDKNDPSRMTPSDADSNRLQLTPFFAKDMAKIEPGATFKLIGEANLRVDGALGFGTQVPALSDYVHIGASVEAGAYAALSGRFEIAAERLEQSRTRVTVTALGTASAGVQLKAFAGVQLNTERIAGVMRGFVDYVASGGKPEAFEQKLSNEEERRLLKDASGYVRLLTKNLAEGAGRAVMDTLIKQYASAYFEARAGLDLSARFKTSVDFQLDSGFDVYLPRADMVPKEMRGGVPADKPLKIKAGAVASLAYDMAMHGDLRLVQQLALIRNSGVRIVENESVKTVATQAGVKLTLPFLEYENTKTTTDTVTDRYTPELGRTRTAVSEFTQRYRGIFGHTEESSAALRVHSPDGAIDELSFQGNDQNFSADFVVQNLADPYTSYRDMQGLTTVLDALSGGRLTKRTKEALASGRYRNDSTIDDINPIHQLFMKPKEFGRSVVHLHIWLGEAGLRSLLQSDFTKEQLLARFGRLALDVKDARLLSDELLKLREQAKAAKTPALEEKLAKDMRDFLKRTRERMPSYAALACLVPESQRAVEMRLSSMVPGRTPIRFTYIQDGRTSEILRVAGFAKMALDQYVRYQSLLDPETRLRTSALLGEINNIISAPSPDMYRLEVAEWRLRLELDRLDAQAGAMQGRLEADLGAARSFIAGIPDSKTIEAVMPNEKGTALAVLRLNALSAANQDPPDVAVLRAVIKQLLAHMPAYRAISETAPLLASTATLANALAGDGEAPALIKEAQAAAANVREELTTGPERNGIEQALIRLRAAHQALAMKAGNIASTGGVIEADFKAPSPDNKPAPSLRLQREEAAKKYALLAGNPDVAAFSYFERAGIVPPSYMGTPYASGGDGIVTGAMVNEADLAMAASRPSLKLTPPKLSQKNIDGLAALVRAKKVDEFLNAAAALEYAPGEWIENPRRAVIEMLAQTLKDPEFARAIADLPPARKASLERLRKDELDLKKSEKTLGEAPLLKDDLAFLTGLVKRDPKQLSFALDNLGYGTIVDRLYAGNVARLDAVMQKVTGDELLALCKEMSGDQKARFYQMLQTSDLSPQTRAKLAGAIVDDTFFFKTEEDLVAALVTGMNAGDLRLFFDQLHQDGKLERFLSAASFWQILLTILTFGLARLAFHDNAAARRVVAGLGYTEDQINLEYGAKKNVANAVERQVSDAMTKAVLETTPMDPLLRHSLGLLHTILGDVKYYDFAALPKEGKDLLVAMGAGAGKQLLSRIWDIAATQKGSPEQIIAEYKRFFSGLSPKAIAATFQKGEIDSTTNIIMKAISDGAIAGLIQEASSGKNKFINQKLVLGVVEATNQLDKPINFRLGGSDLHVQQAGYDGLVQKWELFRAYTGLDYSRVRVIYGGLAKAAGAVTFADTVSIMPERAPMDDSGKIMLDEAMQQTIAFHESVHILQQQIYGESVNAFLDQGVKMASGDSRNGAYSVTEEMFDKAQSVHAFQEHWEQQAELLEQGFRMVWARRTVNGGSGEEYPGEGSSIVVAGSVIRLTPERWNKLILFMRQFGQASSGALGTTGGALTVQKVKPLRVP